MRKPPWDAGGRGADGAFGGDSGAGEGGESFDLFSFSDPVHGGFGDDVGGADGFAGGVEDAWSCAGDVPMDDRMSIEDAFGAARVEVPDLSGLILADVAERGVFLDVRGRRRLRRTRWAVCASALLCAGVFTAAVRSYPELTVWAFRPAPLTDAARSAEMVAGRTAAFASSARGVGFESSGPTVPTIMRLTGFDAGGLPVRGPVGDAVGSESGEAGRWMSVAASPRRSMMVGGGSGAAVVALPADSSIGLRTGVFVAQPAGATTTSVVVGTVELVRGDALGHQADLTGGSAVGTREAIDLRSLAERLGADRIAASRLTSVRRGLERLGELPRGIQAGFQTGVQRSDVSGIVLTSTPAVSVTAGGAAGGATGGVSGGARAEPVSARGWFNPHESSSPR